jgi:hypothetical protein
MLYKIALTLLAIGLALAQSISPPSAAEQRTVLAEATEYVIHHENNLPNFICTQTTRRFEDAIGKGVWRPIDIIVERLTYFEHHEEYKVFLLNGQPASIAHDKLGGATSSGEFGSMMKGIFAPDAEASFTWQNWFTLRGRKMQVYAYRVPVSNSNYHLIVPEKALDLKAGYHGLIFLDSRKHFVHRITLHADGIPPGYPIQDVSVVLDYEYSRIGDSDYLLPLEFELRSRQGTRWVKNNVAYEDYRKFGADSSITFGRDQTLEDKPLKK